MHEHWKNMPPKERRQLRHDMQCDMPPGMSAADQPEKAPAK